MAAKHSATDPISRQHYREMAILYRSLSVEHQEVAHQSELNTRRRKPAGSRARN
jgi:hypothetical protein